MLPVGFFWSDDANVMVMHCLSVSTVEDRPDEGRIITTEAGEEYVSPLSMVELLARIQVADMKSRYADIPADVRKRLKAHMTRCRTGVPVMVSGVFSGRPVQVAQAAYFRALAG